ncbi:MAG: TRAP transporter substrate-binding protein [Gammaproteobacteria bacterium]|nr:TRAP transporter substrate-binding protein [Gammaproteobacteria bacterium]
MKHTMVAFVLMSLVLGGCSSEEDSTVSTVEALVVAAKENFEWKLITTWPKNLPALGTAPERLAVLVDEMSAGQLKIKVYGAGELTGATEVFDAVAAGTAEMGHGAAYYWVGKAPVAAVFTTLPFGMNAQEMNAWLHYGGGLELWRELYEPFNLIPMVAGNSGVQMAGWFNKEINSLEDLKGLKMRIPGLGAEVMNRAGAAPVYLPGGEIFTSLQTGVIDATEWVGPLNDQTLGLHEVAKYYYYPGWHEPSAAIELIVNKDAFESLPLHLQRMVETAARAINQDMLDEFNARNFASLQSLVEEHGVELRKLPDDVIERLRDLADEVIAEVAGNDELSKRIVDSYRKFQRQIQSWSNISEYAYFRARDAKDE